MRPPPSTDGADLGEHQRSLPLTNDMMRPAAGERTGADDSQKLWSVTTEYENLLQVQSQHFEAVLASRDKAIEQLQAGKAGYDYGNPQVVSLAVDERDREIRLYKCLLEIRDKQLMELQHVIDYGSANAAPGDLSELATEKNAQIQTLMDELQVLRNEVLQMKSSSSSSTARGGGGADVAEVAQLRQDKESLEKILLQKERQIEAISTIDTANTDVSALQLGARAISMYTEAMQMRQQLKEREATIATLNQELADLELKGQQRMNELEMKRGELADMTKVIADKTRRVLDLENALQAARQDLSEKTREIEGLCDAVEQARKNTLAEQGAKNRIIEELREELGFRDRSILEERAERVRMETLNEELQIKGNETLLQLKEAQTTMDQMMAHTQYQGQLVRDMTSQVQESESRLHTLQVQEMYEKRRRAVAEKIREQETQQAMESKNVLLSQMSFELNETRDRLGNIRKDLEGDRGAGVAAAAISPSRSLRMAPGASQPGTVAKSFLFHGGGRSGTDADPLGGSRSTSFRQDPHDETSRQLVAALQETNSGAALGGVGDEGADQGQRRADEASYHAFVENGNLSTMSIEEGPAGLYQPYPDDLLDAQLANYLLENPKHVPLFCRLSHGQYLYGTHRVSLRLAPSSRVGEENTNNGEEGAEGGGQARDLTSAPARVIEALAADGKWLLLEELLREKLEQAQMLYSASSA